MKPMRERIIQLAEPQQEAVKRGQFNPLFNISYENYTFFSIYLLLLLSFLFRIPEFPYQWLEGTLNYFGSTTIVIAAMVLVIFLLVVSTVIWFLDGLFPEFKKTWCLLQCLLTGMIVFPAFLIGIMCQHINFIEIILSIFR